MLLFITGMLCLAMAGTMLMTARLLNQINKLEDELQDLHDSISHVYYDVNMVERTIMNRIDHVDQSHTQAENEIRQVISGSMKSSNKRLLKG